ncbi:MAG: hypothetical protein MUC87_11305 [Bacteroidia bacterium]|jgi:hypothetical protein|nr:hypothetical protein [Bacteroidia bacterium]
MKPLLFALSLAASLLLCTAHSCSEPAAATAANNTPPESTTRRTTPLITGFGFEAPPQPADSSVFSAMRRCGGNWVALIPYAFVPEGKTEIWFNHPRQWWGERSDGIIACTQLARQQQQRIMLKPQLWLGGGTFTGNFAYTDTASWHAFELNYTRYILHYARLADSLRAEIFCIGTELAAFVKARPAYWQQLITQVRSVYKGQLTYAENWDAWQNFPHWSLLDYIGVDAYFPLSKAQTPAVNELLALWKPYAQALKTTADKTGKPILFTEYGYRSCHHAAAQPWVSDTDVPVNLAAQENCYEALLRTFVPEHWFAGGFVWKWHAEKNTGGLYNNDFTPQNKPALKCIAKWYAQ